MSGIEKELMEQRDKTSTIILDKIPSTKIKNFLKNYYIITYLIKEKSGKVLKCLSIWSCYKWQILNLKELYLILKLKNSSTEFQIENIQRL